MRQAQTGLQTQTAREDNIHPPSLRLGSYHHEPASQHRNMVVGSSLRRHPKSLRSGDNNNIHHKSEPLALRSKRLRASSLQDRDKDRELDQVHKRRKITNKLPLPLQIPLRGRGPVVVPPESGPGAVTPPRSLDSPTLKPQYDQIRIIEEKARASITEAGSARISYDERRKLRSEHGGSRSKTELAQYFPSFEEMLSLEPPDQGMHGEC
jgi:hypothetical protein